MSDRTLSKDEIARLDRKDRSIRNRRNRRNPSVMPDRLARTSAFSPRKKNLDTNSDFTRTYVIEGVSVVEVSGRELGSQHRDALYALWRLPRERVVARNEAYRPGRMMCPTMTICQTTTTWRELLITMGKSQHVNNLLTMLHVFRDIKKVTMIVHEARTLEETRAVTEALARGRLPDGAGSASSLITEVHWEGAQLDSEVVVRYGPHMMETMQKAHLVSINAEVQFRLKSDYAKSVWPYIDSQPEHTWIPEERIAELTGRSREELDGSSQVRGQFRKEIRQAFEDMERAGGVASWEQRVIGTGSAKKRQYHYVHAKPRQCEIEAADIAAVGLAGQIIEMEAAASVDR